uniref:Spb1_C domain-containing protein n=2 Tax=Macrostomum lignano TaxID=282301 RepID=A0A1I8GJN8_9PLAT
AKKAAKKQPPSAGVKQPRLAPDFAHFDLSSRRKQSGKKSTAKKATTDGDDAPLDAELNQLLQAPLASVRVDVLKSQCLMLEGKEKRKVRARLLVAMGARVAKKRPVGYARLQADRAEAKVRERADKIAERARLRITGSGGAGRKAARNKKAQSSAANNSGKVEKIRHVNSKAASKFNNKFAGNKRRLDNRRAGKKR